MSIRNARGDTIIEVMIAMAILGLVLSFAYASAARSLKMAQDAQERRYATRLAESQVELMKAFLSGAGPESQLQSAHAHYCLYHDAGAIQQQEVTDLNNPSTYIAGCTQDDLYRIAVSPSNTATGYEYAVSVRWDRLLEGASEVLLMYKL